MAKHTLTVYLSEEQEKFLTWLANSDNEHASEADTGTDWTMLNELSSIALISVDNMIKKCKEELEWREVLL